MAGLLGKFFGRAASTETAGTESPAAGEIYAFHTAPLSAFAPPETGRHAAFKIIGVDDKLIVIVVLDNIWTSLPSAKDVQRSGILHEHRFSHTGRIAVTGVIRDTWDPVAALGSVSLITVAKLSRDERTHAGLILNGGKGACYSTLHFANYAAEGEWRWAHDRAALIAENEEKEAEEDARHAAQAERYRGRLKNLTWDQLLSETPFENWSPSQPFPPADFTVAARGVIHDACRQLQTLGTTPGRADVRSVLKATVEWFNRADEAAGGVIETGEREDICAVLEEMTYVARQKALAGEIDRWRDW